jgi:NAD(P)H-flavin reductase
MSYQVPVKATEFFGDSLLLLTVDCAGTHIAEQYVRAGQYVALASAYSEQGFFSIASSPGQPDLSFLIGIEPDKPKTARLTELRPGDRVTLTGPSGPGYPLDEQAGRDLILVGTGTGISPLRAMIWEIIRRRRNFGRVTLVYGATDQRKLAFREEFHRWSAVDIEVQIALSRPLPGWTAKRAYVTSILQQMPINAGRTSAFVCGRPVITSRICELLRDKGIAADRIFEGF